MKHNPGDIYKYSNIYNIWNYLEVKVMSAPLLLVPLVTVLASLLLVSQPAQPLSIIKKVFESKSFYLVFIADGHRLVL